MTQNLTYQKCTKIITHINRKNTRNLFWT